MIRFKATAEHPSSVIGNFGIMNGAIGSDILPNKYKFGELVLGLGYEAPLSVLIEAGDDSDTVSQWVEILSERQQRFCKPLWANRGRGINIMDNPQAAVEFALAQREPYLVQTVERPSQDWRYVFHRSVADLSSGNLPHWRIAYEKVRPKVTGDGDMNIGDLVVVDECIPEGAKRKYLRNHKDRLSLVPSPGETIELIQSGNIAQGAYGRIPKDFERRNLDKFMLQFLHDVEKKLGTILGTLCVDLGIKDDIILSEGYDFREMQKNIVFYEHQLPFGISGYTSSLPEQVMWAKTDHCLPQRSRERYLGLQIFSCLMRSAVLSGIHLRKE